MTDIPAGKVTLPAFKTTTYMTKSWKLMTSNNNKQQIIVHDPCQGICNYLKHRMALQSRNREGRGANMSNRPITFSLSHSKGGVMEYILKEGQQRWMRGIGRDLFLLFIVSHYLPLLAFLVIYMSPHYPLLFLTIFSLLPFL